MLDIITFNADVRVFMYDYSLAKEGLLGPNRLSLEMCVLP